MLKGRLMLALDMAKKNKKQPHERYSYRLDGQWYVGSSGPGYANTYLVTEHDAEGLAWLEQNERVEEGQAPRSAVACEGGE